MAEHRWRNGDAFRVTEGEHAGQRGMFLHLRPDGLVHVRLEIGGPLGQVAQLPIASLEPAPAKPARKPVLTVTVPMRGRKWGRGSLLREGMTLYRVTGAPVHYHEDALPFQKVARVSKPPEAWVRLARLLEILEQLRTLGTHAPESRGARRDGTDAPIPAAPAGERARWEARDDERSFASYPYLELRGDLLIYVQPNYDDSPLVTWRLDAELAAEARALIAAKPALTSYPRVTVRRV